MFLGVIEPKTVILGPKERYIEKGSTINLTCIIHAGPLNLNPSFVFWNYNGKIITYDRERGGTVVISDRQSGLRVLQIKTNELTCDFA